MREVFRGEREGEIVVEGEEERGEPKGDMEVVEVIQRRKKKRKAGKGPKA